MKNLTKQIEILKQYLKEHNIEGKIPYTEWVKAMMINFGMKKNTANRWTTTYDKVGLIEVHIEVDEWWVTINEL